MIKEQFDKLHEFYGLEPVTVNYGDSKICDAKYRYIIDFMNYLTMRKMERDDYSLSYDEMFEYARRFAAMIKSTKESKGKELKKVIVS